MQWPIQTFRYEGGGRSGHPDPEIKGGLGLSVWSKNKRGGGWIRHLHVSVIHVQLGFLFCSLNLLVLFWIFSYLLPSWLINLARSASTPNNSWYAATISFKNRRFDGKRTTKVTSAGTTEAHKRWPSFTVFWNNHCLLKGKLAPWRSDSSVAVNLINRVCCSGDCFARDWTFTVHEESRN